MRIITHHNAHWTSVDRPLASRDSASAETSGEMSMASDSEISALVPTTYYA